MTLPGVIENCYVEGERVGIVAMNRAVFTWAWTSPLQQLDVKSTSLYTETATLSLNLEILPSLILDPLNSGTVYLVQACSGTEGEFDIWNKVFLPLTCVDEDLFTIVVVKFEDGRASWSSEHASPRPDDPNSGIDLDVHFAMSCKKANSHGRYVLGTRSSSDGFEDSWKTGENRWTLTFDIMTQNFSESWYRYVSDLIWSPDHRAEVEYHDDFTYDQCFWNHNFLLSYAPQQGRAVQDGIVIKTISPIGKATFPESLINKAIILHESCITRSPGHQIFMDDEFIVLRTDSGMVVFSTGAPRCIKSCWPLWENNAKEWIATIRGYRQFCGDQIHPPSERCNLPCPEGPSEPGTAHI